MKSNKFLISPKILLIFAVLLILTNAEKITAQTEKENPEKITLTPQTGKGKRDKNIKPGKTRNRITSETACHLEIKNNTAQLIFVYIDGNKSGTISSNNIFKINVNVGRREIYTRTERANNIFLYWGPNYVTCGSNLKDGSVFLEVNPVQNRQMLFEK